ncbi:dnaJ homolog subfamily C member 4 isoform 1-T2 [Clarias gariepinus]|uniref:dnaJ homolog subfamily C member 4 n=1 Tax=Clarias gariepinus TaxID=13013 RepID=UPI00234C58B1|nr:dnaJ homolog subfamily C member 4 [Clarias gariepinus]XP_053361709.1 dnaJ homolog subfamily C member 4 [Clarias gariepinus]
MMQLEAPLRLCHNCLWYYKFSQRLMSLSAPHRSFASYYDILGVKPDASLEQIKNAFFDKSKKLHPDSDPSNPSLHSQFVKLNEAYRVLSKERTRKEYDLRLRYHGVDQSFRPSSRYAHHPGSAETNENARYWEQFHTVHEHSGEGWQKKRKKNFRLVGCCVVAMLLSVCAHYFGFRKLEEVHNDFMDKKDRVINKLYNESKERARVNGFKKQQEILRQKHAEFMERYKIHQSGKEK